jgi:hypothetical protein
MSTRARIASSGQFTLGIPASEALRHFTPEGERAWVPGWNPIYATSMPTDTPGTVFTTSSAEVDTIWVIQYIDNYNGVATYARVTPRHHAGIVTVNCTNNGAGGCEVTVSYDMSLVPGSNPDALAAYEEEPFHEMLSGWCEAVNARIKSKWS